VILIFSSWRTWRFQWHLPKNACPRFASFFAHDATAFDADSKLTEISVRIVLWLMLSNN
jgi:hypothetical protein